MTGLSSSDVIGKDLSILFPPDTKADSLELITRTLSGERWDSVEIPIRGSHGKTRLVLWNSANIYEQDGKTLTATIAQGQDITERKDAERALKQYSDILERSNLELATAKGRLESLIASMPVGILITNLEGKTVATNQSLRDIWRGSVNLGDFEDFREYKAWWSDSGKQVAPEDWPIAMAMKEGKSVPECIFDIERFDGTDGTIICSAIPLRDPEGRTVAGAAFAQDISDLKRFEKAIVEEKNKLSFILNALPVAVSVADASGKLVLVNSQVNVIWGGDMSKADNLSKLAAAGIDPRTGEKLAPDDWPASRVIRTGNPVGPTEIEIVALNGKKKTILASAVPMKDDSGRVTGAVVGSVDITPQKNIEQELAQSNAELQNFAYVASHDLREPLRTISGFLEILAMDYSDKLDDTARDYISRAVNASGRLHNMIDDLLTFSRLETRKQPFRKVDLNEILKVTLTDLSKTIQDHRAKIRADTLPTAMVDELQMTTVFRNLIDNAVKFHGSEPPKVTIKAKRQQHAWEISVTDNGIGIDPAFQGKIFNMFTRLHTRKDYPGNGIGLATCKKIIERHGGHIWVESGSGKGSTFSFTLPDREPETARLQTIESWSGNGRFSGDRAKDINEGV